MVNEHFLLRNAFDDNCSHYMDIIKIITSIVTYIPDSLGIQIRQSVLSNFTYLNGGDWNCVCLLSYKCKFCFDFPS